MLRLILLPVILAVIYWASYALAKRNDARKWAFFFLFSFVALGLRLFQIQVLAHGRYKKQAEDSHTRIWTIPALRGGIYDRGGQPLAVTLSLFSVCGDPSLVGDAHEAAVQLAPLLKLPAEQLEAKLRKPGRFVWLMRKADRLVAKRVAALDLKGIVLLDEQKRVYPQGTLAAQTIGFVGEDGTGLGGLEAALDKTLGGKKGKEVVEVDGRQPKTRQVIPGRRRILEPMIPGRPVTLTLDSQIQAIAEIELKKAVEQYRAAGGAAVVMDPRNGEILALACLPNFDPNYHQRSPARNLVNPAVVNAYEPGSTFKLVMACAALEEGKMPPTKTVYCQGAKQIGRRIIHCVKHHGSSAHGQVNLAKIIEKSCNIGAATVALMLGDDVMYRYAKALGFGSRTGLALKSESAGQVPRPGHWADIQLANFGFGQAVSVTPIQLLTAYATVGAGGRRPKPHLVKETRQRPRDGKSSATTSRRVLKESTARTLATMLEAVVSEGTGKAAQIPGYRVAGKTGTAQKPVPGLGFRSGKHIGSFVGFVPADNPRLACIVVIDEPKGAQYGGVVAAPAFREICRRSLLYLRVAPSVLPEQLASAKPADSAE